MRVLKVAGLLFLFFMVTGFSEPVRLYPNLNHFVNGLRKEYARLPKERQALLKEIGRFIGQKKKRGEGVNLVFHEEGNHRLTVLGEVWAQTAQAYYHVPGVRVFSKGNKKRPVERQVVRKLEKCGYIAYRDSVGLRPFFRVHFAQGRKPVRVFSKEKLRPEILESANTLHIYFDALYDASHYANKLFFPVPPQADLKALNRQMGLEMMFLFAHFRQR